MKKLRKMICIIALLMVTIAIVSCSKTEPTKPKATPEETTKIYLDMIFKNDMTNIDKIGLNDEDSEYLTGGIEKIFLKNFFKSNSDEASIPEEVKNSFIKDFMTGLSKLDYEVLPVSSTEDTAVVEIKTKVFDRNKILTAGIEKTKELYSVNPSMTDEELMNSVYKGVSSSFANGTLLSESRMSIECYLTLEDDVWVPLGSDLQALSEMIFSGDGIK
ncbi:DUF5105 domain-containing protein [Clostridium sp. YIM B02506]|uniref:DUF5105 domain-containing protein n=1 Tax=Clostridium sp. YIM B02506 TaxID=2910680 RepID=UPI001EEF387B|nr:DUF5105 domain-containing protein [Clostridium sp. YIM B02506]